MTLLPARCPQPSKSHQRKVMNENIQPEPCPKCNAQRRLNLLEFLCECPGRTHGYLSYQFPVYRAAPELYAALKMIELEMGNRISAAAFAEFSEEAKNMLRAALARAGGSNT